MNDSQCVMCGNEIVLTNGIPGGVGYGINANGDKVCYACCAITDREAMIADGHSKRLPLYLVRGDGENGDEVTNWPGTLRFSVSYLSVGRHNIARKRYNVWFCGPDGHRWCGQQYGDDTQICHCRRTKYRY